MLMPAGIHARVIRIERLERERYSQFNENTQVSQTNILLQLQNSPQVSISAVPPYTSTLRFFPKHANFTKPFPPIPLLIHYLSSLSPSLPCLSFLLYLYDLMCFSCSFDFPTYISYFISISFVATVLFSCSSFVLFLPDFFCLYDVSCPHLLIICFSLFFYFRLSRA